VDFRLLNTSVAGAGGSARWIAAGLHRSGEQLLQRAGSALRPRSRLPSASSPAIARHRPRSTWRGPRWASQSARALRRSGELWTRGTLTHGVAGAPEEVVAEATLRRVVPKDWEGLREVREHDLHDVLGVSVLEAAPTAEPDKQLPISRLELAPSRCVA